MKLFFSESGAIESLKEGIEQFTKDKEVRNILILACDANGFTPEMCNPILSKSYKPIWGGIYPSLVYQNKNIEKGIILLGLEEATSIHVVEKLSDDTFDFENNIENFLDNQVETKTIALLFDGFSKRISALIEALFVVYGLDYNYIGGGAGSLSMKQKPCIFTNDGLLMDCALIVGLKNESRIGVKHGWNSISGPYKVTSSDKNIIETIDYKPAFEVYKEIVENHCEKKFTDNNFFDIAKAYPFGIIKFDAEKVVRDPLTREGNKLICVGEVPEGSFIDILHGDSQTIIKAAKEAASNSLNGINKNGLEFTLFFDCISRVLFLQDGFIKEINAINICRAPLIGALSIGEVANNKKDYLEFYNKTAVVGSFIKLKS